MFIELTDEEVAKIDNNLANPMTTMFDSPASSTLVDAYKRAKSITEVSCDALFEDKTQELESLNNKTALLFDNFFFTMENIVLAAEEGVGKSLLSIYIAESELVNKALFITLEDYSKEQLPRYLQSPQISKFEIITYEKWKYFFNKVKNSIINKVNLRVLGETMFFDYGKILRRREELLRQYGIKEDILDNILVFDQLMQYITQKYNFDFICLDSLDVLLGHPNKMSPRVLERIMEIPSRHKITFLMIHHLNKKGEVAGPKVLTYAADSVYILERTKQKDVAERQDATTSVITLKEIKSRHKGKKQMVEITRTSDGPFNYSYKPGEIKDSIDRQVKDRKNLADSILDALEQSDGTIELDDLKSVLELDGYSNEGSIKNQFGKLAKNRRVKMADGKSWDTIELLKHS